MNSNSNLLLSSLAVGCDLIEVSRISEILKRRKKFLLKYFLEHERAYFAKYKDSHPHIAGHFAAKEATAKALGWGMRDPLDFSNISISHTKLGQPQLQLKEKALEKWEKVSFQLSISHTRCHALAVVLATRQTLN